MSSLTLKQAIEQGYTHCLYPGEGYQTLISLDDPASLDWSRDLELAAKEPTHPVSPDKESIAETLAEDIAVNWQDQTGDDTDAVYDAIKAMDFSDVVDRINAEMSKINYYKGAGIQLIP